jgi:hypothetical protein
MAELTLEDRENYELLKSAFAGLNYPDTRLNLITQSVNAELNKNLENDTTKLRERIDLVDGYLKIHALILPNKSADVQGIVNLIHELNRSLKVVEDETLELTDEVESFCDDSLFLEFFDKLPSPDYTPAVIKQLKNWTEALLSDRVPNLNETQINQLIQAWGKIIEKFVEDARTTGDVEPGEPETFAHFFCIHSELENLYTKLGDTEIVQNSL